MLKPAMEGMTSILDASVENKVKKIVVTSSFSTVGGYNHRKAEGVNKYTEFDFSPFEVADGYGKSKIAQERIIKDFLEKQSKDGSADY